MKKYKINGKHIYTLVFPIFPLIVFYFPPRLGSRVIYTAICIYVYNNKNKFNRTKKKRILQIYYPVNVGLNLAGWQRCSGSRVYEWTIYEKLEQHSLFQNHFSFHLIAFLHKIKIILRKFSCYSHLFIFLRILFISNSYLIGSFNMKPELMLLLGHEAEFGCRLSASTYIYTYMHTIEGCNGNVEGI